jgi:3-oxoacyl-[acyl-carrier-protein] synthase II
MAYGVGPYITGWSAISPLGIGRDPLIAAVRAGSAALPPDRRLGEGPVRHRICDVDPIAILGRKGTRTLDRITLLVAATSTHLLAEHADSLGDGLGELGLVLGTGAGSVDSIVEFTRDTFVRERPYLVNPAAFPNTVFNGPAGRTAIWHGLRGVNCTVAAGYLSGLAALRYATRMIRRGHASTLVVGCVEELSRPFAYAAERVATATRAADVVSTAVSKPAVMGEGCVLFVVDDAATAAAQGREPLAEIVDFEFRTTLPGSGDDQAGILASAINALLARNGLGPSDIDMVSRGGAAPERLNRDEHHALDAVFGAGAPVRLTVTDWTGDSFGALTGFQLAAALAAEPAIGRRVLLTALDHDGAVACALVYV